MEDIRHLTVDELASCLVSELQKVRQRSGIRDPSRVAAASALAQVATDLERMPAGHETPAMTQLIRSEVEGWGEKEREVIEVALNIRDGLPGSLGARRKLLASQPAWLCTPETIMRHENVCFGKLATVIARAYLQSRPPEGRVHPHSIGLPREDGDGEMILGFAEELCDRIPWEVVGELTTDEYEQIAASSEAAWQAKAVRDALWWVMAANHYSGQGIRADKRDAIYRGLLHLAITELLHGFLHLEQSGLGPFSAVELAHLGSIADDVESEGIPAFGAAVENDSWGARLVLVWKEFLDSCVCTIELTDPPGVGHWDDCLLSGLECDLVMRDIGLVALRRPILEGAAVRLGSEWRPMDVTSDDLFHAVSREHRVSRGTSRRSNSEA